MTHPETIDLKNAREQREHELKVAIINAFAKDPELKYYVGVAVGAGVASISAIFGETLKAASPPDAGPDQPRDDSGYYGVTIDGVGVRVKPSWSWLLPGIAAVSPGALVSNVGIGAVAGWLMGTPEGQAAAKDLGWPETVSGILTLGATGFAGFCSSILILKAMFGEKGASSILSTLTSVV